MFEFRLDTILKELYMTRKHGNIIVFKTNGSKY